LNHAWLSSYFALIVQLKNEKMSVVNPFDQINEKLDQIQKCMIAWFSKQENIVQPQSDRTYSEDFLTLPEVAAILKKPIGTIRRYVHFRGLPAKRLGKPYLIKKQDLAVWLENWQLEKPDNGVKKDGYAQMLEHRQRYSK
jgi:excisionase family DNA binding protein